MTDNDARRQVQQFYNEIGWQIVDGVYYQNARYEDLRPVSREYIHRCHLRAGRSLKRTGRFLLDAGSGPVQYPEYLTYSEGYENRVCLDLSMVALIEARKRLASNGLYVVADVAHLPFAANVFDGLISLHTLHHLGQEDQLFAYDEFYRVLTESSVGVVVNGWQFSPLMKRWSWLVKFAERLAGYLDRHFRREINLDKGGRKPVSDTQPRSRKETGTFVRKIDAAWLREHLGAKYALEIRVWRSVSVRWMRALIHRSLGGRFWLRLLYWLEERWPHYFGERGQYPLIILRKE